MVTFADISHYQVNVNLSEYKAAGHDRIVMKATGGALDGSLQFVDPTFAARWRQAGQLKLGRVAYHFARNNNSGAAEFAWCWQQIDDAGGLTGRDVLCYDQEDNRPGMTALAAQRTREFVAAAVRAGVTRGWIYSGKWFLEPAGITATTVPAEGWRQLWISDYTAGQADTAIEVPAGWTRAQLVARQYTDAADLPGIPNTDANRVLREWLTEEDDVTAQEVWDQPIPVPDSQRGYLARSSYTAAELLLGPNVRGVMLDRQITTLGGALTALSRVVAANELNDLTAAQVEEAAKAGAAAAVDPAAIAVALAPLLPQASQDAIEGALRHVFGGLDGEPNA